MRVVMASGVLLLFGVVAGLTTTTAGAQPAQAHSGYVNPSGPGYVLVGADGGAFTFGGDLFTGSMANTWLGAPIVSVAVAPDGAGYWELGRDGGVFAFGDADFEGSGDAYNTYGTACGVGLCSTPTTTLRPAPSAAPAVGITASGFTGYVMARADGSVYSFGDAYGFYSGLTQVHLTAPIVGIALDSDGRGAWLAAADGGVFALGDAPYLGSLGGLRLDAPIVGIAADPTASGYWLVGSDGGVFAFGGAPFSGSLPTQGVHPAHPIVGMAPAADGHGYWLTGSDGGVFALGDTEFEGGAAGRSLAAPVVAVSASNTLDPCQPALRTSTDKTTYSLGSPVTITISYRNPSPYGCAGSVAISCGPRISVIGPSGQVVWQLYASLRIVGVTCPQDEGALAAGEITTYSVAWGQDNCAAYSPQPPPSASCPETQVPAGEYTATETWGPGVVTSASISISP